MRKGKLQMFVISLLYNIKTQQKKVTKHMREKRIYLFKENTWDGKDTNVWYFSPLRNIIPVTNDMERKYSNTMLLFFANRPLGLLIEYYLRKVRRWCACFCLWSMYKFSSFQTSTSHLWISSMNTQVNCNKFGLRYLQIKKCIFPIFSL